MREFQVTADGGSVFISPLLEDGMPTHRGRLGPEQIDEFISLLRAARDEAEIQAAMANEIAAVRKKYGR